MISTKDIIKEYGYSRDRVIRACKRLGIKKFGNCYMIESWEKQKILQYIVSRKPGNPNFLKKSTRNKFKI